MALEALARLDRVIGNRIRLRRAMLGLSQKQLGHAIGLTPQQVQKYEKGTNRIAVSTLARVAEVLEVPVSFFFVLPRPTRRDAIEPEHGASVADMADRRETLDLLRAFRRLDDPRLRRHFVLFVRHVCRAQASSKR
jgi:transcriptional regulator with XRE-family HTH domain